MEFVLGFLDACLGIIAGIGIIVMIIYVKVRGMVGPANMKELIKFGKKKSKSKKNRNSKK